MAVYEVYTQPELRRYKTQYFSKATLFQIITLALTWIPPLLIALRSQGFWQRVDQFIEQPEVHFKHDLLLELVTASSGQFVTWSTYSNYNNLQMDHLRIPVVKSYERDVNHDGLNDELRLELSLPLQDTEQVYMIRLMLVFDYILEKFGYTQLEAGAYLEYSSSVPGGAYHVSGDLQLVQREPINHKGIDTRYNTSIIPQDSLLADDYLWSNLLAAYSARNLSTTVAGGYPSWSSGRGAGDPFLVNVTLRYPVEFNIQYYPGFWQLIKFGWVQYVTLLIPFWFLMQKVKVFAFSNQLVTTIVERPFKMKTY